MIYASDLEKVDVIPSGLFLDNLTGVGGIPRGKITELYGEAGVGKSTLTMQLIANAQKQGYKCMIADVEYSYVPRYGEALGIDNEKLGIVRMRCAEDVLMEIEKQVENFDLIILDSVGGLTPKAEIEKSLDSAIIAGQAKLVSKFCRKVVPLLEEHQTALITINHAFTAIDSGKIMTSGGAKLNYHKSLSIRLRQRSGNSYIKQGDRIIGKIITIEVKKNKVGATEGVTMDSNFIIGEGFSATADVLEMAIDKGIIEKRGNTFYFGETKLGVGKNQARKALEGELLEQIKAML